MSQDPAQIVDQLLMIEKLFGDWDFIPAELNPLPELTVPVQQNLAVPGKKPQFTEETITQPAGLDVVPASDKQAALQQLWQREIDGCKKCQLFKTRTKIVFGEGNPQADLMIIGEGPGADEDVSGRPFVGRAGKLLTKMIVAMGLSREKVFIANMVKCRPPGNRNPAPEELQACWGFLVQQLQIIRPKIIVTLGNPATQNLLQTKVGITKLRGNFQVLPDLAPGLAGIPVMPTYHPSFVLRNYNAKTRGLVWSDLQQVMQFLNLPMPQKK